MSQNVIQPYRFAPSVPYVAECWYDTGYNGSVIYYAGLAVNQVISAQVITTSNQMYDWNSPNVRQIGMLLCADAGLSGGLFRLGIWDGSTGNLKVVSDQFTCADVAEGSLYTDVEEFLIPLSTTTSIIVGDCVGMINNESPTGTGYFRGAGTDGLSLSNWGRQIFIQGTPPSTPNMSKIPAVCLTT